MTIIYEISPLFSLYLVISPPPISQRELSRIMSKQRKSPPRAGSSSVDSYTAVTSVPVDYNMGDSNMSVQSAGNGIPDSLSMAMEKFGMPSKDVAHDAKMRRFVCAMIQRNLHPVTAGSTKKSTSKPSNKKSTMKISNNMRQSAVGARKCPPPANLLRPPRGNSVCSMRDVVRGLLSIRKLHRSARSSTGARLIRTLDPTCTSHSDIALCIYLICTL
jgi:hypothetical protein